MRVLALLAVSAALLCLASHPARADIDLAKTVARLASDNATERSQAYTALGQANDPAVIPLLAKVLPRCSDIGQYYGMLLLQRFPLKKTRVTLSRFATADSAHLRVLAGAALQRAGERGAAAIIVKALQTEGLTDTQRAMLLTRIYNVRDLEVQKAVRAFLQIETPLAVLQSAIYDVYLVRDRAALEGLKRLEAHAAPGVRAMAGACRMLLGDAGAAPLVAAAFADGGIDTASLYKVKNFLQQARPVPEAVLAAVHGALDDETNGYALRTLIEILGEHGYAKATKAIRALLDYEDANVSKAAFEALAKLPGGVSTDTMRKLLVGGDDARKLAAANALRRADDTSGFAVVVAVLASGERLLDRQEAARLLANFRRPEAVDPLLRALEDPQSTVRSSAFFSLGSVFRALFPYRRFDLGSTGYIATGAAAARGVALAKLRTWWAAHKKSDW